MAKRCTPCAELRGMWRLNLLEVKRVTLLRWTSGALEWSPTYCCAVLPLYDESTPALGQQIISGKVEFPSPYWDEVSENAKSFVRFLLNTDPAVRPTAEQALAYTWNKSEASSAKLSGTVSKLK